METRIDFVTNALTDTQKAIRSLELKAGAVVVFETAVLVILVSGIAGNPFLELAKRLVDQGAAWYAALLVAVIILVMGGIIVHIFLTIRVVLPIFDTEAHVILGGYEPKHLYHPAAMNKNRQILPPVTTYTEQLAGLSDEELANEYAYELLRLSYVRRIKSDRLSLSFLLMGGLIIGVTLYGILFAMAGVLY